MVAGRCCLIAGSTSARGTMSFLTHDAYALLLGATDSLPFTGLSRWETCVFAIERGWLVDLLSEAIEAAEAIPLSQWMGGEK